MLSVIAGLALLGKIISKLSDYYTAQEKERKEYFRKLVPNSQKELLEIKEIPEIEYNSNTNISNLKPKVKENKQNEIIHPYELPALKDPSLKSLDKE